MNTQETYTLEISAGTILFNRSWASLLDKFKAVIAFLPGVVQTSLNDIVAEIEANKSLLSERKNTVLDLDLAKHSAFGLGLSYQSSIKTIAAQKEISEEFYNSLMGYVEARKDLLSELTGLTANSLVEVIGCAIKEIVIVEDSDYTPEGIVKKFLQAVKPHAHKLIPLTKTEWLELASKDDSLTSAIENALAMPFVGEKIRKELRRYIGSKGSKKGYHTSYYFTLNMKTSKDDTIKSLGNVPFGKSLIKRLTKKKSFIFRNFFEFVFISKANKEKPVDVEVTFTADDPIASAV